MVSSEVKESSRDRSRMTECPFEIRILRTEWGTWKVQVRNGDHNHDASINDSEHSQYRRPADTEVSTIRSRDPDQFP